MKANNNDRICVLACAVMIVVMTAIGEYVGTALFAIFGLYYTLK